MSPTPPSVSEVLEKAADQFWSAEERHVHGRALWIDLETAQRPSSGECIVGAYWSVHPERGVAFYYQPFGYARSEEPSPQCNYDERTSRLLTARCWPGHECQHIPVVYLTHARRAMSADKAALRAAASKAREASHLTRGEAG